jgi:hypothetical protein
LFCRSRWIAAKANFAETLLSRREASNVQTSSLQKKFPATSSSDIGGKNPIFGRFTEQIKIRIPLAAGERYSKE